MGDTALSPLELWIVATSQTLPDDAVTVDAERHACAPCVCATEMPAQLRAPDVCSALCDRIDDVFAPVIADLTAPNILQWWPDVLDFASGPGGGMCGTVADLIVGVVRSDHWSAVHELV